MGWIMDDGWDLGCVLLQTRHKDGQSSNTHANMFNMTDIKEMEKRHNWWGNCNSGGYSEYMSGDTVLVTNGLDG